MSRATELIKLIEELLCESPHYKKNVTGVDTKMANK